MNSLLMKRFSWENHSEMVKGFHEDIVISSFPPKHMTIEVFHEKLRRSEEHGLPAYMRELQRTYDEGKDGMFIWEIEGEVVGWSWLRLHENEFFEEGVYGEINESYVP